MAMSRDFSMADIKAWHSKDLKRPECKTILNNKEKAFQIEVPEWNLMAPCLQQCFKSFIKMERHSNLFAVQACGVVSCPPLPLPSLHRVGGEAPSVPARSYTGLQRTCNQIKHTLHSAQNASIFHEALLSSFASLNPTTHVTSVLMLCPVWFRWGTFC